MSKKRKTRKQKEDASKRHVTETHIHLEQPTYSISTATTAKPIITSASHVKTSTVNELDTAYLRKDMISIAAASGIILAFDILLFVLLKSGTLRLGFLGY